MATLTAAELHERIETAAKMLGPMFGALRWVPIESVFDGSYWAAVDQLAPAGGKEQS